MRPGAPSTLWPRAVVALGLCLGACDGGRPGLRPWRPEDHDSGVVSSAPAAAPGRAPQGADNLGAARAIFVAQCASCHGEQGHGDGPMAAMFRPADLASQAVQAKTDDELARVIAAGRARMPAFGERLAPEALPLLVRLIRSFR
jgi:mono/diheme cytochrome c family protein